MAGKGTAGIGLVVAAALIIFAILAPGSPERPTPSLTGFSGSGLLTQRAAYGAALGGQTGALTLAGVPTQEEIEKIINDYLAQATEDVKAELAALVTQNVAGAKADIQAQISGLASQFVNQGVSPDQLLAALRGPATTGGDPSNQLSKLLAPYIKSALSAPTAPSAAPSAPRAPAAAPPAPAAPNPFGNFDLNPGDFSGNLKSSMDQMGSKMGDMDMNMDMDF